MSTSSLSAPSPQADVPDGGHDAASANGSQPDEPAPTAAAPAITPNGSSGTSSGTSSDTKPASTGDEPAPRRLPPHIPQSVAAALAAETMEMPQILALPPEPTEPKPEARPEPRPEPRPAPGPASAPAPTEAIPAPAPDVTRPNFHVAPTRTERRTEPTDDEPRPRHMRSGSDRPARPGRRRPGPQAGDKWTARRTYALLAAAPLALLVLLIVAWAVDTTILSGQVARNVEVAGISVGGKSEDNLPEVMSGIAEDLAARPVTITVDGKPYNTTAAALGLAVDERATIDAALEAGDDGAFFLRPFTWLGSFFSSEEVPLTYTVSEFQTVVTLQSLQGTDLTAPVEPTIQLSGASFVAVPGQVGQGIDPAEVVEALPAAAKAVEGTDKPITIEVGKSDVAPRFTDQEAQALADRANTMTALGITLQADGQTAVIPPEQLRAWMTPQNTEAGMDLVFDTEAAKAASPGMFGELGGQPVNATVRLEGGTPVVVPGQNGVNCCGDDAGTRIWEALKVGQTAVELEATIAEPEFTTAEVESWGITQPVGGARAWRSGGAVDGPTAGFTTYFDCCLPRVTNIQRIAQLVDGAVIPPGGSFSVNEHVGPRTEAKGFVSAGAIREGLHVEEIGGGVSQFATTTFNAAYFAGLDIPKYQAHTEYFSRYPRGREATMGYPNPDLVIENNTPYGVLIDTSYTGSSLTVTMWSTPYATAEQTNISEGTSGACAVVTTTRTRSFPDGTSKNDTFRATYRPGEGIPC